MVIIDLKEITQGLGAHFDKTMLDSYYSFCDCGCQINQDVDQCLDCDEPIVWRSSRVWREKYLKKPHTPKTGLLFQAVGATFQTGEEYHAWIRAIRTMDFEKVKMIIRACKDQTPRGRGLMKHVLNTLALQTPVQEVDHGGITAEFENEDGTNVYHG